MKLSNIVNMLRQLSPSFEGRVGASADFSVIKEDIFFNLPAAYVIPLDDRVEDNQSQTDYWQKVIESFGVIVALKAITDHAQLESYDIFENIKMELWRVLLGFELTPAHHPIQYDSSKLLDLDHKRIFYQFNFSAIRELDEKDTRQYFDLNPTNSGYNPLNIGKFDILTGTFKDVDSKLTVNFENNNIYEDKK